MNWDLDDLLKMVDEWKFKLHDKLKNMTPEERIAYWKEAPERWAKLQARVAKRKKPQTRKARKPKAH